MLPKGFQKTFCVTRKIKKQRVHWGLKKMLSHDFGNVTVYVRLHDTVAATGFIGLWPRVAKIISQIALYLKELSMINVAGVLNLDLLLHCSIKMTSNNV